MERFKREVLVLEEARMRRVEEFATKTSKNAVW